MCTENENCAELCNAQPTPEQLESLVKVRILLAINRQLAVEAAEKRDRERVEYHRRHVRKAAREWVKLNLPSWLADHLHLVDHVSSDGMSRLSQAVTIRLPGYLAFGFYMTTLAVRVPEPEDYTHNPPQWEYLGDRNTGANAWFVDRASGRREYASSFEEALEAAALPADHDQADGSELGAITPEHPL